MIGLPPIFVADAKIIYGTVIIALTKFLRKSFPNQFKSARFGTLVSSEFNIFRKLGMSLIDANVANFTKTSI